MARVTHLADLMHRAEASNGTAIPSNWILSTDGTKALAWRPETTSSGAVSYGSNATHVSDSSDGGAATTASRSDHRHLGVRSVSHASNTFFGDLTLQTEGGLYIVKPGPGILKFGSTGGGAAGGGTTITVEEVDGSPTGSVSKLVLPNGTLSIVGSTATYTPSGSGTTIEYGDLKPATPTLDFTGSDLASATATSYQGSFAVTDCYEQAVDGSHLMMGYASQMGHIYWSASNVDQELIVGNFRAEGNIQILAGSRMYGIALLDTSSNGVGIVVYGDNNVYLAEILNGQYNAQYGNIAGLGHDANGLPHYTYALRLTRVGNTWDGYLSVDGDNWDYHMSATGSKTITVARKAIGLFYNTGTATHIGTLQADYLHTA